MILTTGDRLVATVRIWDRAAICLHANLLVLNSNRRPDFVSTVKVLRKTRCRWHRTKSSSSKLKTGRSSSSARPVKKRRRLVRIKVPSEYDDALPLVPVRQRAGQLCRTHSSISNSGHDKRVAATAPASSPIHISQGATCWSKRFRKLAEICHSPRWPKPRPTPDRVSRITRANPVPRHCSNS